GPGHFFEATGYNDEGSSVLGFDPVMVDSLAARVARAVHDAAKDLRPARVAWGSRAVWGQTRIRSLPAMLRNIPLPTAPPDAPAGLAQEYRLVDPELTMLRVDVRDAASGAFRPAGAFSIFAMHGTGNAPSNDLLDPDIQGLVERRLERHIDRDGGFVPRAVYLFANGAEGDVSPAWPPQSRCDVPTLAPLTAVAGPFTPNPDVPGCQGHKRQLFDAAFGGLPNHLFISGNLPSYAQVTVLRLGDRVIGAVPGEVTTTAGRRMREQMLASAREAGLPVSAAL